MQLIFGQVASVAVDVAIDPQGNLYTAEVGYGRRLQKFERVRGN